MNDRVLVRDLLGLIWKRRKLIHITDQPGIAIQVAVIEGGLESGLPSIAIRIDLPDGRTSVVAETTARLFCMAARIVMAKYPDLFEGE
jgi:hypothetical protein